MLANSQRYVSRLGAGASYLLEAGGARLVLDAASGTAQALAARDVRPDAVLVAHFHADTVADLVPAVLALAPGGHLFLPEGKGKRFEQLVDALDLPVSRFEHARVLERAPGEEARVGEAWVRWGPGALRVEADGASLVYVGDGAPATGLADFARGAHALLVHTQTLEGERGPGHTAGEAGRLARDAAVRRLFLAHLPFYPSVDAARREAQAAFGGEVVTLQEGAVVGLA